MNLKGYIKLVVMALAIMFLSVNTTLGADELIIHHIPITPCSGTVDLYKNGTFFETYNLWWSAPDCVNSPSTSTATWGGNSTVQLIRNGYYPSNYWAIPNPAGQTVTFPEFKQIDENVIWDKNEYEKGETATISVSFNNSNFDTVRYNYEYDIADPGGEYVRYQELQYSSSQTFQMTLNKAGIYEGNVYISDKNDLNNGYYCCNYTNIVVTDGTQLSFVNFNKPTYRLGDTSIISWGISSSIWDTFGYRYIEIYKDGQMIDELNSLSNFGTRNYKFPSIGEYQLKLWKFTVTGGYELLKTSLTSWVEYNPSYIIMNSSIPIKTNIFVNYTLGETDGTSDLINVIEAHYLNPYDNSYTLESSCYFNNIASSGSCIMNVDKAGTYLFTLENLRIELLMDSELINSYYVDLKPEHNYTTNSINVTKDQWYQGDYISGNYQVKASQFNSSEIYLNYYSNTDGYKYSFSETLLKDTGTFNNFIAGLRTGQNTVYLNYTNSTSSGTLAQKTFNVSSTTSTGYGLTLSSYEVGLDEIFNIYVTIPPYPSKGKLRVVEQTYNQEVYNVTLNNSMVIPQKSSISGTYSFILSDQSNEVQVMRLLVVKSKTDNTTSTTTTAGSEYGLGDDKTNTGMVTNLIILLGMPIFWGLAFLLGAIYYLRKNSALILPVLFILINVEAVVGLLQPYTIYIVVVTWLVIAIDFIFVQRKATG